MIHYVGSHYERDTSGSYTGHQHYIRAGSQLVGIYRTRSSGSPFMSYYFADHLGSVDAVTGESGNVAARFSFDAWGRPRNANGTDNAAASTDYKGFTKHEHDDEVVLINMNAREYDPQIGRFISPDPVIDRGLPSQGLNRYTYVGNNPLSFVDPDGYGLKKWWKKNQRKLRGYLKAVVAVAIEILCDGCGYGALYFASSGGYNEITGKRKGDPDYMPVGGSIGVGGSTNNSFNYGNYFAFAGGANNDGARAPLYVGNFGTAPRQTNAALVQQHGGMYLMPAVIGAAAATAVAYDLLSEAHGAPITDEQRALAEAGDRRGFWESRLRSGDPIAQLALSIVDNTGLGKAANDRLIDAARDRGLAVDLNVIGVRLMQAHVRAIVNDGRGTVGLLNPQQIAGYHHQVFADFGLPPTAFGGTPIMGRLWEADATRRFWCNRCDHF